MGRARQLPTPVPAVEAAAPVAAAPGLPSGLTRRQLAEMTVPGVVIGALGGLIAGGLAASGGLGLLGALIAGVALAVPLALAGAGYELLLATGRVPMGPVAPTALYWLVAFPVARIIHAAVLDVYAGARFAVPYGWLSFIVYQVLVAVGFAIGYWWLHENFAPRWWWHLRDRNPVASHFMRFALQHAVEVERQRERKRSGGRPRRRQ